MMTVGERIQYAETVAYIRHQITSAIDQAAAFVETVERTDRLEASFATAMEFAEISEQVKALSHDYDKYTVLFPEIQDLVKNSDYMIDTLGIRFRHWTDGKQGEPESAYMSVKEAMAYHKRSRSTIYRWIHKGRLEAVKQGRFWQIAL